MAHRPGRPAPDEYAPFYAGYVARVPDGDILEILQAQLATTKGLLAPLSREQTRARPTPEDWNILEVLGHITDGEQVFAYRALRIGRGDLTPLAGFEQDDYVRAARSAERTIEDLLEAYAAQRRATIATLRSFDAEAWLRSGTVSGNPCSARSCAYIAAGHELHHIADLHERYGIGLGHTS
ncbi:DinB family protein [Oscillochloris sp. ZM17-4]|uniref:DinB family protein n=1 Tax=Oscillochloris sp. ZM17-4 TaxID=2866714 RepID=UPI001C72DA00|nr:DinB family protein [Oscillochloris sp. ZM17-4]MBX0326195.1 DinB family protein [Oscillochloris sp. ZM17-4]